MSQAAYPESGFDDLRKTVGEYSQIVRRRWRIGLLALGIISSAAFWASQYLPREFSARTVFERRDDVVLMNLISSKSPYSFNQMKTTLTRDMTGSRALADAALALGLVPADAIRPEGVLSEDEQARLERTLSELGLRAQVELPTNTVNMDTVELVCTAHEPDVAKAFVVALRDRYIAETRARITGILERAKDYFESESARYEQIAAQCKAQLTNEFAQYPGVDPTNPNSIGARVETLRDARDRIAERRASLIAEIEARERFLTNAGPLMASESVTQAEPADEADESAASPAAGLEHTPLDNAIATVQAQIDDLLTLHRMTPNHPRVRAFEIKLEALQLARREFIASWQQQPPAQREAAVTQTAVVSPLWEGQRLRVQMELQALRSQLEQTEKDHTQAVARHDQFAGLYDEILSDSSILRELEEKIETNSENANIWRHHLAQLSRVLDAQSEQRGTEFVLVEEPRSRATLIKPRWISVASISSFAGLAAALLLIALAELLDRSYRSMSQVARSLNVPVLDCVAVIDTPTERRRRFRSRLAWTPALSLAVLALLVTGLLAYVSMARPALHARLVERVDRAFATAGLPTTAAIHSPSLEASPWAQ